MTTKPLRVIPIPAALRAAYEFRGHSGILEYGGIPVPLSRADDELCQKAFHRAVFTYLRTDEERQLASAFMGQIRVAILRHGYRFAPPKAKETPKAEATVPAANDPPATTEPKDADKDGKAIEALLAQHAAALQDLEAQVAGIKTENASLKTEVDGIKAEKAKLKAELKDEVDALNFLDVAMEEATNAIHRAHAMLQSQINDINAEHVTLMAEVADIKTKNATLETELNAVKTENATLTTTLNDIKAEIATLSTTVDRHKTDNAVFKSAVRGLTEGNRTLQGDIAGIKTENAGFKAEIKALDTELESIQTQNAFLGARLKTIEHDNAAPKTQLEQLKNTAEASDQSFRAELDKLKAEHKNMKDVFEQLTHALKAVFEENINEAFENQLADVEFKGRRMAVMGGITVACRERVRDLEGQVDKLTTSVSDIEDKLADSVQGKPALDVSHVPDAPSITAAPAVSASLDTSDTPNTSEVSSPSDALDAAPMVVVATKLDQLHNKLNLLESKLDPVLDTSLAKQDTPSTEHTAPVPHILAPSDGTASTSSSTAPASDTVSHRIPSHDTPSHCNSSNVAALHPDPYFKVFSHIVNTLHGIESHLNGGRLHKTDVAVLLPSINEPPVSTLIDKQLGTVDPSCSQPSQNSNRPEHEGMTKDKVDEVDACLLRDIVQRLEAVEAALHLHEGLVDRVERVEKGVVEHNDKLKVMLMRLNMQHEEIMRMSTGSDTATAAGTKGKGKEAEDKTGNRMDSEPSPKEDHKSDNKPAGINRDSTEFFQLPHPRLDDYESVAFVEAVTDSEDEGEHVSRASWSSRATNRSGSEGGSDSSWITAGRPRG